MSGAVWYQSVIRETSLYLLQLHIISFQTYFQKSVIQGGPKNGTDYVEHLNFVKY